MDESLGASRYGPADRSDSGGWHGGRGGHSYRGRGGRDRSGNRDNRRNHYNSHRGGHRGPRPPGNRFTSNQATVSLDPEVAMRKQLAAMVARVGELNDRPEHLFTSADDSQQRPVVKATQKNITDLATVLCAEANAPLFLKFQSRSESISIADAAGPLAALLVNCAATLPLQTPAYVGLTLAVNHHTPAEFAGFASRCIDCALSVISQLFDQIIQGGDNSCMSPLQHLLRYLALLGKANLVEGYDAAHIEDPTTVMGLLLILVKAATKTADTNTSIFLRSCILNTVPYVLTYIPRELLSIHILTPLEDDWQYASVFSPGIGAQALLLKGEQKEEGGDDEDEDDGDDDEEEEDSGQVCDTLQDLTRCVKIMVDDPDKTTRFTLFTDAPWDTDPLTDKVRLSFLTCKSIPAILNDTEVNVARPYGWEGTVLFGRLPIFGSPAGDDEEDDDGDDDDMDDVAPTNVHTQAYEKNFSLLDRFFIADAIRHCLICHQSAVTDSGVTRGSAKDTAQQIWSICHLLDTSDEGTNGIEYIMVETLLSLILQSFDSRLLLGPLYVSRVLLELVRAQPAVMPQAVAVGVSNLFQLYLPSLVPCCRDNFSSWLAFHLINTDYQWPKAYWDHWANYVTEKRNSRGDFVMYALELMGENLSSRGIMVSTCLPSGSSLATKLLKEEVPAEELSSIEQELRVKIWEKEEDPDALRAFVEDVNGTEDVSWLRTQLLVRSLLASVEKHREQQRKQILDALSATNSEDAMDAEESEQNSKEDVLVVTTETIVRYKSVIRSCIEKDHSELETDEEELLVAGHAKLLETVAATTSDNRVLLEGCLKCLLDNDIVEGKSVVRWLVGSDSPPPLHWWNLAIMVVRAGIDKAIDVRGYNGVMMIDRSGDADADEEGDTPKNAQLVEALTEFAGPLVKATVVQVCQRLSDSEDPKRLTPVEADLVEGLKRFVVAARMLIYEALTTSATKPMSASGAMALIVSDFGLSGEALADSCRDSVSSSNVVEAIIAILGAIP